MSNTDQNMGCFLVLMLVIGLCVPAGIMEHHYRANENHQTAPSKVQQTTINKMKMKYRELRFNSIEDENNWIMSLRNVTVLHFEDRHQDLIQMMIDEEGVILQTSAHGRIYLDGKVDLNKLTVGHPVDIKLYQQYEYKTYPGLVLEQKRELNG